MTETYSNGEHMLTLEEFNQLKLSGQLVVGRKYNILNYEYYATKEDLELKQNITDNGLATSDKTVVGAINELDTEMTGKRTYHGIESRLTNPLPNNITTTTFTINTLTYPLYYWYKGKRVLVNTNQSCTISNTVGLKYIYFNEDLGTLISADTFAGFGYDDNVILAMVYWNGSSYGVVYDERHSYNRNHLWHKWAHNSVGVRYFNGLNFTHNGGTGNAITFSVTGGKIYDEDIDFDIITRTNCRVWYQTGATSYNFDNTLSNVPCKFGANIRPVYADSSNSYTLTEISSNPVRYMTFFMYTTNDISCPIYIFCDTNTSANVGTGYTSLANARARHFPSLVGFGLAPELKPIWKIIINGIGVIQAISSASDDFRMVTSLPQAGNSITTLPASNVTFNPTGGIESINVQSAVAGLDIEKQSITDNSLNTTDKTIVGAINEVLSSQSGSTITTYLIDNPIWTIQPTISGSLDAGFVDWNINYYYVTLKDTSGVALSAGQFKLTLTANGYATAVNQIFSLTNLNTGNSGILIENSQVEFKTIGANWAIRDAYGNILMPSKSFNRKITAIGLFISRSVGTNYINYYFTNNSNIFTTMANNGSQNYPNAFYIFPAVPFATDYKYSAFKCDIDMVNIGNSIAINCQYTAKQGKTRDQWFTNAFDGTTTQESGRNGYIIKKDLTSIIDSDIDTPVLRGYFGNGTIIRVEDY